MNLEKKKYFIPFILCALVLAAGTDCKAQQLRGYSRKEPFVVGYGVTIGGTRATQKWDYQLQDVSEKMKYRNGFNGSIFGEFLSHDIFSWISELQYNQKGAKVTFLDSTQFKSRTNYLSFNNFLKMRSEGYDINLYFLFGPRIEYLVSSNGPVNFNKLHLSASAGVGCDFNFLDPWILFTELHYNPDITKSYSSPGIDIKNRAWELKIGIKRNLKSSRHLEECPPVFL